MSSSSRPIPAKEKTNKFSLLTDTEFNALDPRTLSEVDLLKWTEEFAQREESQIDETLQQKLEAEHIVLEAHRQERLKGYNNVQAKELDFNTHYAIELSIEEAARLSQQEQKARAAQVKKQSDALFLQGGDLLGRLARCQPSRNRAADSDTFNKLYEKNDHSEMQKFILEITKELQQAEKIDKEKKAEEQIATLKKERAAAEKIAAEQIQAEDARQKAAQINNAKLAREREQKEKLAAEQQAKKIAQEKTNANAPLKNSTTFGNAINHKMVSSHLSLFKGINGLNTDWIIDNNPIFNDKIQDLNSPRVLKK